MPKPLPPTSFPIYNAPKTNFPGYNMPSLYVTETFLNTGKKTLEQLDKANPGAFFNLWNNSKGKVGIHNINAALSRPDAMPQSVIDAAGSRETATMFVKYMREALQTGNYGSDLDKKEFKDFLLLKWNSTLL